MIKLEETAGSWTDGTRVAQRGSYSTDHSSWGAPFMRRSVSLGILITAAMAIPSVAGAGDPRLCFGREPTITGTPSNERIPGTSGHDVIFGGRGKDHILGMEGRDLICGGAGRDSIIGGPGRDLLGSGHYGDLIQGGHGPDRLYGHAKGDHLYGGAGADRYSGGPGRDVCRLRHVDLTYRNCEIADPT